MRGGKKARQTTVGWETVIKTKQGMYLAFEFAEYQNGQC